MLTAFVYRRALRRFATSIVFTILDIVVYVLMLYCVSEHKLSPLLLLMIVPLAFTLVSMWRCTLNDLACIGVAISATNTGTADQASAQV
jgi:hypothetical protein